MAQQQGGVYIDLSGYRVCKERAKDFICFIIKIRLGQFSWTVYRRFTQFRSLSEQLRRTIPDAPACPPKRVLGAHTPEFLEQRRVELLEWVRQLARDERVCRSPEFHEFLRAEANVRRRRAAAGARAYRRRVTPLPPPLPPPPPPPPPPLPRLCSSLRRA
jgi:hypothetical protein